MQHAKRLGLIVATAGLLASSMFVGVSGVSAEIGLHGIGLNKGCDSPTKIGDPYVCDYTIFNLNPIDSVGDTLTFHSLVDTVNRAPVLSSGNILSQPGIAAKMTFNNLGAGAPSCTGLGTATPLCTLPGSDNLGQGSSITISDFSFTDVTAADYAADPVNHILTDTVTVTWNDVCDGSVGPPTNCPVGNQTATSGSSTVIQKLDSSTATDIHDAAHAVVTTVAVGTTVHDLVTVTGQPNKDVPTGNVNIDWFLNGTCTGAPATNSGSVGPLAANGTFDATGFSFTVNTAGFRAFRAHYEGDGTYNPSDGPCEPLRVVDANIQITPDGTNRVGATHTFTAHVNVNDGTGFVPAPDGTQISFTIDSGPGGFTTANPCITSGGTGSCSIDLTSAVTGVTTVSAHTTVSVAGVVLTRNTDGVPANSGPAVKTFVNARISIAPNATNEVGAPHTFTVTLQKDLGDGAGFVAFSGAHVDFSLTDSLGAGFVLNAAASTCDDAGANTDAAGQCLIVFTSPTPGQVTGTASWTGSLGTPTPFTVMTNGTGGSSGPAVKTFVDANIQITPQTANNPVSTNHTLVGHVNINAGLGGGYVNAPDGTVITFSLTNSGGATASFVGPNTCATSGGTGSCSVVISSSTTGTTTVKAVTTVSVGGVSLHRETGDGKLGDSADANKTWSDDVVTTRVLDASNNDVTNSTVPAGTVVHDEATVAKAAGTPAGAPSPTGTVSFTLYDNGTCNGAVVATDPNMPLSGGVATSATFTTPATGGTFSYLAHYNGDANYPARNGPCEPFTVETPRGQITPTNVECADFVAGAPTLAQINYSVSGGKIHQNINPGVFFFWTTITTTTPNQVVTVSQSNTSTNNAALFTVHQGWDRLYKGDCSSYTSGTLVAGGTGATFLVATPGTYHIGIKYSTKSIAGTTAPVPDDITYNFSTSLGGNTGASVLLDKG